MRQKHRKAHGHGDRGRRRFHWQRWWWNRHHGPLNSRRFGSSCALLLRDVWPCRQMSWSSSAHFKCVPWEKTSNCSPTKPSNPRKHWRSQRSNNSWHQIQKASGQKQPIIPGHLRRHSTNRLAGMKKHPQALTPLTMTAY